ncbi:MAG: hypothetical protein STHCBS139747_004153 [Sporothrix thermara]
MWTGMPSGQAQTWADQHNMRTLSTVMGEVKTSKQPHGKKKKSWTKYMRGASAVFASKITADRVVTVLCPPPPHRFNPGGGTNMQMVELPILTGIIGGHAVSRIEVVHPMVKGAENARYQLWPNDEVARWVQKYYGPKANQTITKWPKRSRTPQVIRTETLLESLLSGLDF